MSIQSPTAPPLSQTLPRLGALVVDDEEEQLDWLSLLLTRAGETPVYRATSGEAALERMRTHGTTIGLLICDLKMSGMDGMALLRLLGEAGHQLSVIIVSSWGANVMRSAELMMKSIGHDVLGTLTKPVAASALANLLRLYHVAPPPTSSTRAVQLLPEEFDQALARGEIVAYFQPKIDMTTGGFKGVETLARYLHPKHGVLRPAEFLPLVDSVGRMSELTQAIIKSAIEQAAVWRREGLAFNISINLSLAALENADFCEQTVTQLAAHGLTPFDVTFEILESSGMKNIGRTLETMARLRLMGFGLAIDDFGIGFSSLEQLSNIPFTELKIDRSFVRGVAENARLAAVVQSCVELAERLQLKIVAEGVETRSDWDFLQGLNIQQAQGYLIARPMTGGEVLDWVTQWQSVADYLQAPIG